MLPPSALLESPFTGPSPLLAEMRAFLATCAQRPVELELVLRVTMHSTSSTALASQPDVQAAAAITQAPERWGIDRLRLWPQLPESLGVWLNLSTSDDWFTHLHALLDAFHLLIHRPPLALLHDLEPRKDALVALLSASPSAFSSLAALRAALQNLSNTQPAAPLIQQNLAHIAALRRRLPAIPGLHRHTAAVIPVLSGLSARLPQLPPTLRSLLLHPHTHAALYDGFDAMCYTSMSAWFLPATMPNLQRAAERSAAAFVARDHSRWCRRVNASPGILLGCTGTGLLGNEPLYSSPTALALAASAARSATHPRPIDRIGIYNLRGLLETPSLPPAPPLAPLTFNRDWRPWLAALLGATWKT